MARKFFVVTGTRRSPPGLREKVRGVLATIPRYAVMLVGDAQGADEEAITAWHRMGGPAAEHRAFWYILGKYAGPARNASIVGTASVLLERGWECVGCWAFPDSESTGTPDCKRRLEAIGLTVEEVAV